MSEWSQLLKSVTKMKRKIAQDVWLLRFGLGLRRGHTRDVGALIVKCATRLAKIDGMTAKDLKAIRKAAGV